MPTFLASDLIASLQRDPRIAFAAEIGDRGTLHRVCSHVICTEGVLAAERGDLVGFARHGSFACVFEGGVCSGGFDEDGRIACRVP